MVGELSGGYRNVERVEPPPRTKLTLKLLFMTTKELYAKYTEAKVSRKKKGAGKGYKTYAQTEWRGAMSLHDYMTELKELDRTAYGLELCRIEYADMTLDRWWDCDACRKSEIKAYRRRIAAIRKEYGLSYESVQQFYGVD